jgi:S1-C subfamily serine protease
MNMRNAFQSSTYLARLLAGTSVVVLTVVQCSIAAGQVPSPSGTGAPGAAPVEVRPQRDQSNTQRRGGGWFRGRGWRGSSQSQKNHTEVKSAYKQSAAAAAKATAQIFADDEVVALATVVDADGYLVTKASLLVQGKKYTCKFPESEPIGVAVVGTSDDYDLALLKVDGLKLTPGTWRTEAAGPGTLVAAVDQAGGVISVGVISTEPRQIRGTRNPRRAWLGVSLGAGEGGNGVVQVIDGSAAKRAGLKPGDRIRAIDGDEMKSMERIISIIGNHRPGDKLALLVQRGDETLKIPVTLGKPAGDELPQDKWGGGPFSGRREDFPEVITHDTIIRPEQCGGPLVDSDGNIVGVNIARALRVTTYAIPAETVQRLVQELKKS